MATAREGFEVEDMESEAAFGTFGEGDYEDSEGSDGEDIGAEADYEAADTESEPEADLEDSGETDEGYYEASEADSNEAVAASADTRRWVGQVAADQRREALRAAATQQDISRRLRSIPMITRSRPSSLGRLQGGQVFRARLPNGHETQLVLTPNPAPLAQVERLRAAINANDQRQTAAIAANARSLHALAATQATTVKKLIADNMKNDRELSQRMSEGLTRLDKRITTELSTRNGALAKHSKRITAMLRRQRRKSLWRSLAVTTAMPVFAAYGDRSSPFSRTNLMLTGSLAAWLVGDEVIDRVGGSGKEGRTSRKMADLWSTSAFVGNPATAYYLFHDKQNQRFVTGIETGLAKNTPKDTSFAVATGSADDFAKIQDKVPVVATIVSGGTASTVLKAAIANGKLQITATADEATIDPNLKVAWMVDTRPQLS